MLVFIVVIASDIGVTLGRMSELLITCKTWNVRNSDVTLERMSESLKSQCVVHLPIFLNPPRASLARRIDGLCQIEVLAQLIQELHSIFLCQVFATVAFV